MAAASPKGRGASAKAGAARGSTRSLPPLVVRYPCRMKRQRVYPCDVRWQASGKRAGAIPGVPVVVRLVMAGAQVVPAERTLDPNRPEERALFYVTPLGKGWLRGERLEVLQDGRKVQEIPLPAKVVSQRITLVWLVLAFLVPWLWQTYIRAESRAYLPGDHAEMYIREHAPPVASFITDNVPVVTDNLLELRNYLRDVMNRLHYEAWDCPQLPYYIGGVFLLLALLSWFFHRDKRKRRVGRPIPLPEADEDESPPLATHRGHTVTVEPIRH